ncbi:Hpt domain-containing protein [Glaciimonas sp. Gout2]|uniref:Hpt domain-containing protein n=1 Tax=unclassified Glaciimonas TaxID=2644401 RepID=UPI002B23A8B6|nr:MULTISPECIES: Hpt domain-containing protein [unclassified Glaciimonas]MEB0010074.1 Hpt domain-containing protein [Glaciimonas sp. Cout2]MEB0081811.1 Hpt domain-containing protein [Glaciimonas sp. Gout2]
MSADIKLTDPSILMRAVEHDEDAFDAMSRVFLRIYPEMIERLDEFVAIGNLKEIAHQAHSLANCLFIVGATCIGEKMQDIETDARQKLFKYSDAEFSEIKTMLLLVMQEVESNLIVRNTLSTVPTMSRQVVSEFFLKDLDGSDCYQGHV